MIERVKNEVNELLNDEDSGHDISHIERVLNLSLKFSKGMDIDKDVVSLIALLHDVDDYKLFGDKHSKELINARIIMDKANISVDIQDKVVSSIASIGYNKRLNNIIPLSIEGKIVSDADMCDALGVNGILRTYKYSLKHGKEFFDKNIYPTDNLTSEEYKSRCSGSSVCHIFEKILKLKDLMFTDLGKKEALKRHKIVVDILYNLFDEENAMDWKEYLDSYLKEEL